MKHDYELNCSCGGHESADFTTAETIMWVMDSILVLEALEATGSDMHGLLSDNSAPVQGIAEFMLAHWRHGEMVYRRDSWSPFTVLVKPEEAALPVPCPCCKGRRLVPCPECVQ